MKTVGYLVFTVILILLVFIIIPNSPIYSPLMDYLENRAENRWGVDIIRNNTRINPLRGTLALSDFQVKTPETSGLKWDLFIKKAVIKVSYPSLIATAVVFDNVTLDTFNFVQTTKAGPEVKSSQVSTDSKRKEVQKNQLDKVEKQHQKHTRIKRFVVRNGRYEFNIQHDSGMTQSVKAENVNMVRKDVILDRDLNGFFRSFLDVAKPKLP